MNLPDVNNEGWADVIAWLHNILLVLWVVTLCLLFKYRFANLCHCTLTGSIILSNGFNEWNCPLFTIENTLRKIEGSGPKQTFLLNIFEDWIGIDFPDRTIFFVIAFTAPLAFFLFFKGGLSKPPNIG